VTDLPTFIFLFLSFFVTDLPSPLRPSPGLCSVQEIDLPPLEPEVTTVSSPLQVRLAQRLSAYGARMYGAFWCSHCYDQKQVRPPALSCS